MLHHSLTTLSMGLPVVTVPMPSVKSVTVLVLVNTGSRYEKPKEEGIAHFFEHMVFKGTAQFPDAQSLASVVDSVGADFNAFTSKEYTGYYVKSASKNIRLALDVVSDMLLTPRLRQEDIDREKGVIIEEINMYADSPARHINDLFDRMMFKGSGLGHDIIGTKQTVSSFTTNDFIQFLRQWYGYGNMLLVMAGDDTVLNNPATFELAEEMFSKESPEERIKDKVKLEAYLPKRPLAHDRLHLEFKQTEQAHFVLGWPAVDRTSPARYALSVVSTVLGGNMSSRLFSEVREKRGLSYYIHADTDLYHDVGLFGASAGVDPHRVEEALKVTIDEFRAVASGEKMITEEEMKKAKDYIAGKMVLGFEDSENVAQYYGMRQLLTDVLESPEDILKKIRAVTQEEIQAITSQLVKDGELRLAVIGPFKEQKMFEDIINS
jgi:predicted Zn-dependent peptidase